MVLGTHFRANNSAVQDKTGFANRLLKARKLRGRLSRFWDEVVPGVDDELTRILATRDRDGDQRQRQEVGTASEGSDRGSGQVP